MAVLIGMSDEVRGKTFEITRDKLSIGRNSANMITVEHPTVSGRHCCIVHDGKRYVVTDLGSTNGTRLNSREITEAVLKPKDLLQVGSIEFMFDAKDAEITETVAGGADEPKVEITSGPATAPVTFGSISPFGTRRQDNTKKWILWFGLIGLLAMAALAYLIFKLMGAK